MPWKEVTVMEEKIKFIQALELPHGTFSDLCSAFGISAKTGYKYLKRYKEKGLEGLKEINRQPKLSPAKTSSLVENLVLKVRHLHPSWGGEKIKIYLLNKGYKNLPSEKTIDRILKRNGLITAEESEKHTPWKRFEHEAPNDLWQMDFKGHFATAEGRCHPLTLLDDHSRFSLLIKACSNQRTDTVKTALINVFLNYGLPSRMTMDNGTPWGYSGKQEHTTFSAWLIRLGIFTMHSRPMHPQTQGKLERFHRTLKAELLNRFCFNSLQAAQEGFDWWRKIYNEERPHAAIEYKVPSDRYKISRRQYPDVLPPIEYASDMHVRKVQQQGIVFFKGKEYRIGNAFYGNPIGLKETNEDGVYDVFFCHQRVIKIDLRYPV